MLLLFTGFESDSVTYATPSESQGGKSSHYTQIPAHALISPVLASQPHLKVTALREDARVVVRHRCHRRETVAFKRIIGVVRLKVMMWTHSQRWRPSARASWPWADLWTHPRLPRSTPTRPVVTLLNHFSTGFLRIDLTFVAARLGFVGDRTGPDSASDHSSVEIEIVGFLRLELCLEKHREECSWPNVGMACSSTGHRYCHNPDLFNSTHYSC